MITHNSTIALIIPDFDYGGEEKRVVFFANNYINYFKEVYVFAPNGKSTALLSSRVKHIVVNVRNPKNILTVIKIIKEKKINVLQGHKRATLPYLLASEKLLRNVNTFNFDNIYLKYNWLFKFISPKRIIYLSDVLKNFYHAYYVDHINTTINMGGEFVSQIHQTQIHSIKEGLKLEDKFVFLSLGRLSIQKNHFLLLDSLSKLNSDKYICLIAGSGPLEMELKGRVRELDLGNNIIFLGHRTDIQELLNISDAITQTSIFEGFPNVFIEAASIGIPIVATNVGSAETLVKENGILVASQDIAGFTKALNDVMSNYTYFKKNAIELKNSTYIKQFHKDEMLKNYISYYESIQLK